MINNIKKKRRLNELPSITVSIETITSKPIVNRFLIVEFFSKI